jgi:hypothetical protein
MLKSEDRRYCSAKIKVVFAVVSFVLYPLLTKSIHAQMASKPHTLAQKLTYVRGGFDPDCRSLYVFDAVDSNYDALHHTISFRLSGSDDGKYRGSFECIFSLPKIDSCAVIRLNAESCWKGVLPKPAIFQVTVFFQEEGLFLRKYAEPSFTAMDHIHLFFFSAFEAYDFTQTLTRFKSNE